MYDGVFLLAKAMQKANSIDPKKYKPVLAGIKYSGQQLRI
jgi:branched-chain amino acid transport system substrate-binding protein